MEASILEIIKKRKSIRRYLPDKVDRKIIDVIIDAGRLAPSSQNTQSWRYIVIDDDKLLIEFNDIAFSGLAKPNNWIRKAPCIILGCCDKRVFAKQSDDKLRKFISKIAPSKYNFLEMDVAISMQNMVLQATELGLGTCYVGWFNKNKVKKFFKLPKGVEPILLTPIGYEDNKSEMLKFEKNVKKFAKSANRKEVEEITFYNKTIS
ncbi:MAG: nitroreductase family protein [Pseudomonadota bacterium]